MKLLTLLIWMALSQVAFAQTAVVKSGDHPGFTRLVLELPTAFDWKMGRTDEGYELRIADQNLRFDLTSVFTTIGHDRLASIWADPATGGLRLGIACACFAQPFEFRPGIIVIDLRDGPPPESSVFETALDGADTPPLTTKPSQRPRSRPGLSAEANPKVKTTVPYDWLAGMARPNKNSAKPITLADSFIMHNINDLTPFRDALLLQLSNGAAQGIVQMTKPTLSSRLSGAALPIGPRANIHIGEAPGFDVETLRARPKTLLTDGAECIPDDTLNLGKWGSDQPIPIQLAESRANLVGEFDRPEQGEVIDATKLLIYLGFGAEARQLLEQFSVKSPDRAMWNSMAKLVDGMPDADGPFIGMQTCDTAAALWAAMAAPHFIRSQSPRPEAVLRAFSALPGHLRQSLGPDLVAKFIEIDDVATARSLRQAVQRSGAKGGAKVTVMSATIDIAAGNPAKAVTDLEPEISNAGPATAETLIALVDAQLAAGQKIDPKTAVALSALVKEQSGNPIEPALRRAQILALGSADDFDQAFRLVADSPDAETDLWALLAKSGSDTAILNHAVLPIDAKLPALPAKQRIQIADHLLTVGLPDAALAWIGDPNVAATDKARLIAAKAYLAKDDPQGAITSIANLADSTAADLRAQAFWQQDKPSEAAKAWAQASNAEADLRAQSWAQNWEYLAKTDASRFKAAAELVGETTDAAAEPLQGPLAIGNALVADSEKARAILATLLQDIPVLQPQN